jgi:hypothetical protein
MAEKGLVSPVLGRQLQSSILLQQEHRVCCKIASPRPTRAVKKAEAAPQFAANIAKQLMPAPLSQTA